MVDNLGPKVLVFLTWFMPFWLIQAENRISVLWYKRTADFPTPPNRATRRLFQPYAIGVLTQFMRVMRVLVWDDFRSFQA